MNVVILCGGRGTRLAEETEVKPKPMVELGDKPILWHIMKIYEQAGFTDFFLPLGYKGHIIKDYFLNYQTMSSDLKINMKTREVTTLQPAKENWSVSMIETGADTLTGGRLKRLESQLRPQGTFMLTYGDGVADVDISQVLSFHKQHGGIATMTAVRPGARFGSMSLDGSRVSSFVEKSQTDSGWVNGGFFVFEPDIFDYLDGDSCILERQPMEMLASKQQLFAYQHPGFWQCMDTIRDKLYLNKLVDENKTPWLSINQRVDVEVPA